MSSTPAPVVGPTAHRPGLAARIARLSGWGRREWGHVAALLLAIAVMHLVGFGVLLGVVVPAQHHVGTGVFGIGLGLTAYTYGLRHAFDADHIAAIDNTTRKLREDGRRPTSVGFWFSLGHSTVVTVMAALVGGGTHLAARLQGDGSGVRELLGIIGTVVSGGFLYLIAALNLAALVGIWRVWRQMRSGRYDEHELERHLASRGVVARLLGRLTRTITHPGQMYLVGLLFGLGFDTASEVALLVLAASGAASGLPWYAVMVLPLLFAAGMSLLDTIDGLFMGIAYDWAFLHPVRKVYYNLVITGLSVAVAVVIGTIELVGVLHDDAGWTNPVTDAISSVSLDHVGYVVVALFVATWAVAVGCWRHGTRTGRWGTAA